MPTIFEQAAALTSSAVDLVYGELFTVIGMKDGVDRNSPKAIDADRPAFTVTGAFFGPAKIGHPHARGTASNAAQAHVVSEPFVSIDNAKLAWAVAARDRVTRLKTGEQYEISRPMPDAAARTLLFLTGKTT